MQSWINPDVLQTWEHTLVSPSFETSSEAETSGAEQEIQYIYTTGTKQLTLEDVIELSSKGDELVWEDLDS